MNKTDYLHLSDLKIFKSVRESLPKDATKTTNVLTIKDGFLYAWNFADKCVLTLNIKAARSRAGDDVTHQTLLPVMPVLFTPEYLIANDNGTLLIIAGSSGVLVMELPPRYPPYGAFEHNKELVYCKSHCLDERLLLCSEVVQVRQVRFHPGSPANSHVLVLTSDNMLRLYNIENSSATSIATYPIGQKPMAVFPGTKTSYLQAFGEVAVDFDFGTAEMDEKSNEDAPSSLLWPVYILRGDGNVYSINIPLDNQFKPRLRGPLPKNNNDTESEACSILSMGSTPEVFCIAFSNGTIYHSVLLQIPDEEFEELKQESSSNTPQKELLCFESIELELGLSTSDENSDYTCPIFLHKDQSRNGRYFATHSAGIHSISITCLKDLQIYAIAPEGEGQCLEDIFIQESKAEYILCTKTANSEKSNPIIGFALYYDPTSLIAILGDGGLLSLALLTTEILPRIEDLTIDDGGKDKNKVEVVSPLKKMLKEPFDCYIQKILKKSVNQPILKLTGEGERSNKECLELIERASLVLQEQFENHTRAQEEIEKRVKALEMMKDYQSKELARMNGEKQTIKEKAENLAEKYEDLKDKQDVLMKRCENLLILATQKKTELSDAEGDFLKELGEYSEKIEVYKKSIEKLKLKMNYQKLQIKNWKEQEEKKISSLGEKHSDTIKINLKEMGEKIGKMVKLVKDYKERLNLK